MRDIGLNASGQLVDADGLELQAAFKLYPWEHMLREPYAPNLAGAGVRWIEPAWKAILSNKGILPLLWERHPDHPNLLPAYFADDPAATALGENYVSKPLFSREGANVVAVRDGVVGNTVDHGYGAEGHIRQALLLPPEFSGRGPVASGTVASGTGGIVWPVLGVWMVGDTAVGLGVREDSDPVTRDLARFVPHIIEATVRSAE
jgi:glutathionylspermidine synthase